MRPQVAPSDGADWRPSVKALAALCVFTWTASCLCGRAPGAMAAVGGRSVPRADFYVSPDGDDQGRGTAREPFATIARARDAVRRKIATRLTSDVTVLIRGGTYELAETLTFGPEDSGTARHSVTYAAYPGEEVVVSGGRRITGWRRARGVVGSPPPAGEHDALPAHGGLSPPRGGVWQADVPGVREGEWRFRNLFVGGRRAIRARSPNPDDEPPMWRLRGADLSKDLKRYTLTLAPGLLGNWKNEADVEVLVAGNWAINRKRLQSIDADAGVAVLAPPHAPGIPWNQPRSGRWCCFENARELLDRPGEWYLDRGTGIVSYLPREGEDMTRVVVTAPVLTRLLEVKGSSETDGGRPVRNLHFSGLAFEHTDWPLPAGGYLGVQACHYVTAHEGKKKWERIPAAIRWDYVESSSLTDGRVAHLSGSGIELVTRCNRNVIEGNHVFDVSANGIMLGGPKGEEDVPKGNRIANNHVHACGIEFHGAVGIWTGFAERAAITHNLVHDLPYTGISVGWQWNPQPTPCRGNLIEYNHIYDVMKRLGDGGGIYTLGFQPGTVIRGNHIHDVRRSRFAQAAPNNGMFIDEGSKGFLFEKNVIYSTAAQAVRFNQCRREWHTWRGNQFGATPPAPGKIGTALSCDGAGNFVEAPHSDRLEPEKLTVEAWIRMAEYPSGRDTRRWIVNKNGNEWVEGHYALVIDKGRAGAYLNVGGGRDNCHSAWSERDVLAPGRWHHLAMTYDGSALRAYADGRPVASTTVGRKRKPGSTPLNIGRRQDGFVYFKGVIDEVRVYDRALPAAEIRRHCTRPAKVRDVDSERGLVGYWSFDDLADAARAIREATEEAGLEPAYRKRLLAE